MKLTYLAMLGAITLLTVGCGGETPSNQTAVPEESSAGATSEPIAQATTPSGNFVAAEHPTQGIVRFVTENGQRYLEFDEAFKTDQEPDLFVLLHREQTPQSYQQKDYVSLGELQEISGTQRYAIPTDVDPADFRSVVIWCRKFNATFGYAALST